MDFSPGYSRYQTPGFKYKYTSNLESFPNRDLDLFDLLLKLEGLLGNAQLQVFISLKHEKKT